MKKVVFALLGYFSLGFVNAQEKIGIGNITPDSVLTVAGGGRFTKQVTAQILAFNTSGSQVLSINNYAPVGAIGNNLWLGDGGQSVMGTGTQGSLNLGIGSGAMFNNTTGAGNTAIGRNAMYTNTIGDNNMALGSTTLSKNTSGYVNVAIGNQSLQENTTGYSNMAIGYAALNKNTEGLYNNAIGSNALSLNTLGSDNTAIGGGALENNLTGGANIAIGRSAMFSNTTAFYNDVIGYQALYSANSEGNQAIGFQALYALTSGNYNIGIGFQAGRYTSTGGANQTSSRSIYIGTDSRASLNGNTNEIVIGYTARGNGSYTTTIGNSSTTHTVLQYGKTLIGYSASQDRGGYPLQVNGQIYATNAAIATSDMRLKEHIERLPSGLKEVMALRPSTFDFRQGTGLNLSKDRQIGFIAQEVASAIQGKEWAPSVVQDAGGNLGIAETKLIPLLVKAIQEQQAQIEVLNAQILRLSEEMIKITSTQSNNPSKTARVKSGVKWVSRQ